MIICVGRRGGYLEYVWVFFVEDEFGDVVVVDVCVEVCGENVEFLIFYDDFVVGVVCLYFVGEFCSDSWCGSGIGCGVVNG